MKTSRFVMILMPPLAALVACQAGFAQVTPYAVMPTAAPGHTRPFIWRMGAPVGPSPAAAIGPSDCNSNTYYAFTFCPSALQSIYAAPPGDLGSGSARYGAVTIAIVDAYYYANVVADLQTFNTAMNLPQFDGSAQHPDDPTLTIVGCESTTGIPPSYGVSCGPPGGAGTSSVPGWELETMLDIEYAHAMAPHANILLVEALSDGMLDQFASVYYASQKADIVSNSWGGPEFFGQGFYDSTFNQGAPILFASGDHGYITQTGKTTYEIGPEYPCTSPAVTCVGGTTLLPISSLSGWRRSTETAWSCTSLNSCFYYGGSGGGCSAQEALPIYQRYTTSLGGASGGLPTLCGSWRAVPDIAADANPNTGVLIYDSGNGGYLQVGGTSLACPLMAGVFAQVIYQRLVFGNHVTGLGSLNPALYAGEPPYPSRFKGAAVRNYPYFFFDIVSGTNFGYNAGPGYDLVTGLGVPIFAAQANNFFGLFLVGPPPVVD
jgi:subtilase family serine protease